MTSTTPVTPIDAADFDWSTSDAASAMRQVVDAATSADGRSPLNEATLLSLRYHGLQDARLYLAEAAAGFALMTRTSEETELNLVVAPDVRRKGIGADLADTALKGVKTPVSAWSHGNHPAAAALGDAFGFDRVRDLWVMHRSLSGDLPVVGDTGPVDVRPFAPGRDEESFLAVNAEAFAHHPEQGNMTRADLDERMAEPWFDPAGFFIAERDGEMLGFHWTKVHEETPAFGEVYVVGVSPDAQGLGLGKTLTLTGLHHLQRLGLSEVILYVESDNAPAIAVYERLGFTHADADTDVRYVRI